VVDQKCIEVLKLNYSHKINTKTISLEMIANVFHLLIMNILESLYQLYKRKIKEKR